MEPPPGDLVAELDAVGAREPQRGAFGRARPVLQPDELRQAVGSSDDVGGVPVAEDLVGEVGLELSGLGIAGAEISLWRAVESFCKGVGGLGREEGLRRLRSKKTRSGDDDDDVGRLAAGGYNWASSKKSERFVLLLESDDSALAFSMHGHETVFHA